MTTNQPTTNQRTTMETDRPKTVSSSSANRCDCPGQQAASSTDRPLWIETEWKDGLILQCPHCHQHLLPCECCGRITRPFRTHQIKGESNEDAHMIMSTTTAMNGGAASHVTFNLARCDSCQFLTPLPAIKPNQTCLRTELKVPSLFPWSLIRAWRMQLEIDPVGYIAYRTRLYLEKLDEFKTLSNRSNNPGANGGSGGSGTHSSSSQNSHYSRLCGAQVSKSQDPDSLLPPEIDPPMPLPNNANSAAHASAIEQQLLHTREQLLQCQELKERLTTGEDDDESDFDFREHPLHQTFTTTHLKLLQFLLPSSSTPSSMTEAAGSTSSVSSAMIPFDLITRFLDERQSILSQKASVEDSWRLLSYTATTRVPPVNTHPFGSTSNTISTSPDLTKTTAKVLINHFQCRFQREELLLQGRLQPFHQLLQAINDTLLQLYDAFLLASSSLSPTSSVPTSLLAQVCPPSPSASEEAHTNWIHMIEQVQSLRHTATTPPSYRQIKKMDLPVEDRNIKPTLKQLPISDLQFCIDTLRLLYGDIYHTIALREHQLKPSTSTVASTTHPITTKQQQPKPTSKPQPPPPSTAASAGLAALVNDDEMDLIGGDGSKDDSFDRETDGVGRGMPFVTPLRPNHPPTATTTSAVQPPLEFAPSLPLPIASSSRKQRASPQKSPQKSSSLGAGQTIHTHSHQKVRTVSAATTNSPAIPQPQFLGHHVPPRQHPYQR